MARTSGHGNPDWTRDETILALELYQEADGQIPGPGDARVVALSELLRSLPIHPEESRKGTFRNPEGVAFKLQNLRAVETGKGLKNTSATDREVWSRFGTRPAEVKRLAALIRSGAEPVAHLEDDEEAAEFGEGRVLTKLHRQRERDRRLRKHVLALRRKAGPLACDCCGSRGLAGDNKAEAAIFEVHHLVPLAQLDQTATTKVKDVSLLCANCHRAIHRLIIELGRWVTPAELRSRIGAGWTSAPK